MTYVCPSMMDEELYYERVANYLARMREGDTFCIPERVREENRPLFISCFRRFCGSTTTGAYWWDWDGETGVITKYERLWYKLLKEKGRL